MCPGDTCTSVNLRRATSPISTGLGRSTSRINVGSNINISSTSFSLSTWILLQNLSHLHNRLECYPGLAVCQQEMWPMLSGTITGVESFQGGWMKRRTAVAIGGGIGGLALYNRRLERSGGEIPDCLGGQRRRYRWKGYDLAYSVAGEGEPLLLVHGVYAGASSFEFRKNFRELSKSFRVYALDLLGCGLSERPERRYGPEDVASQVEDFVREEIGGQAHLIASSLSAALVVPAAVRSPRLFKKLVLICPTGYGTLDRPSGRLGDVIYGLFLAPLLGNTLYHAIVSRWGLRYYLGNMAYYHSDLVTEDLIEDYYRTSHRPGARYF